MRMRCKAPLMKFPYPPARDFHGTQKLQQSSRAARRAALDDCLYDFPESRRDSLFLCQTADDVLTGDDADEAVQIVHYGNEVVPDDGIQQLINGSGDADGGIFPEDIPDVEPLQLFHGAGTGGSLVRQKPPEEISLADGAYVLAFAVDNGDGAAAMVPELFQTLADGVVVIQVGDALLRRQEISNIHSDASFLLGRRESRLDHSGVGCISIIYRERLGKW